MTVLKGKRKITMKLQYSLFMTEYWKPTKTFYFEEILKKNETKNAINLITDSACWNGCRNIYNDITLEMRYFLLYYHIRYCILYQLSKFLGKTL